MKLGRYAACGAVVALTLAAAGCSGDDPGGYRAEQHTRVSRALPGLTVENALGNVTIDAWSEPYVQVDAIKRGPSKEALANTKVLVVPSGATLDVRTDFGTRNVTNHRSVALTIHTPASTNIEVTASLGNVDIEGFAGNVHVTASLGNLTVAMAKLERSQQVELNVSLGNTTLTIPRDASATIDAQTSLGKIAGDDWLKVQSETVGSSAHGTLGSGAAKVDLTASTGSVNIDRE